MNARHEKAPLAEVRMVLAGLDRYPRHPVPPPYTLRDYRPGDRRTWVEVHREAERYHEIDEALHDREFGLDQDLLARRQLFLCDGDGQAVGTATAWFDGEGAGRIHWVAIVPRAQGRGLGKVLVSALCDRFVALGHRRAFLTTETVRLPAIRLYLSFGFVPDLRDEADRRAWREVAAAGVPLPGQP